MAEIEKPRRFTWEAGAPAVLLLVIAAAIAAICIAVYEVQLRQVRDGVRAELQSIADLKGRHISTWIHERWADGYSVSHDPIFADVVAHWLDAGGVPGTAMDTIESYLSEEITAYGYDGIVVFDSRAEARLSIGSFTLVDEENRRNAQAALRDGRASIEARYIAGDGERQVVEVLAPISGSHDGEFRPIAVVLLRIDVGAFFLLVQEWPTPSLTAEAYLVGWRGDSIAYITSLRHLPEAPLKAGLPARLRDYPAIKAMGEFVGELEDTDYRGIPVVASVREMPELSWYLVAKIDAAEAYAPARQLAELISAMGLLSFALIGGAVVFTWRSLRARRAIEKAQAELALQKSEERYRDLFNSGNDGILIVATDGRILEANKVAWKRLGRSRDGMLRLNVRDINPPEFAALVDEQLARAQAVGTALFETAHVHADGRIIPMEVSAQMITYQGAPALLATARDITERKRLAEAEQQGAQRMENALMGAVRALATLVEKRDPYTAGHQEKATKLCVAIGRELGFPEDRITGLRVAAEIYDVGKISVPAEILSRPVALTEAEIDIVRAHADSGYEILKGVQFPWPVAEIVRQHHERMDGSGYPRGLKGDAILLEARILAVADTVSAMTSHRPYRTVLGTEAALAQIEKGRGTIYDPQVADACLRLFREKGFDFASGMP